MTSVSRWLESKLRLKVSATKTKVVRPTKSVFLGFTKRFINARIANCVKTILLFLLFNNF